MAALHPFFACYVGDTAEISGTLLYADGTPFNLASGAVVQWTLENAAGAKVLELSLNAGITVADETSGTILITMTPEQTAALPPGRYADQLRATDPNGFVSTQWAGAIEIRPSFFTP